MNIVDGISALEVIVRQIVLIKIQKCIVIYAQFEMWPPCEFININVNHKYYLPLAGCCCCSVVAFSDDSDIGLVFGDSFGVDFGLSLTIKMGNMSALLPENTKLI
jgi:hypothetical protein